MNENEEAEERQRLRSPLVYEIVRREAEVELARPLRSLWWSGVAAGIALSSSLLAEGLLHHYLPDAHWKPVVESFGYSVGFVIVMLARLQLFTEQTVTAVIPLLADFSTRNLARTGRLWSVVLTANLVGTAVTAAVTIFLGTIQPEHLPALLEVSREFAELDAGEAVIYGIPAGFFIAAIVWMLPSVEGAELFVIIIVTWLIAVGGFAHVVVGSAEVFMLQFSGELGLVEGFSGLILPSLMGNIIGGTGLFAMLAYGQVRAEL
ncbi:MAG TPA: formate/nitrite transporter family protein [Woeseiaceae bacterium]|nr:formate/nitrite transporter family protein [Woeseiaceae bacterium]